MMAPLDQPLGSTVFQQTLTLVTKRKGGELDVQQLDPVAFVPMTGEAQKTRWSEFSEMSG